MQRFKKAFLFFAVVALFFVIGVTAQAQELKVLEFRPEMSMVDAVRFPKNDLNGERCGLVRLGLVMPDAVFEGDIISSEYKEGEWWIYMPKGSNWLTIKSMTHVPLRYEFEPIQSNVTYLMTVVEITGAGGKPKPTHQYLAFQITPTNAILEVNGQLWEVGSDGSAMKFVSFGTYNYRVQAPNYHAETGIVIVNDPENTQIKKINLKSDFVEVTLKVDADAEIWVNDEKKGVRTWTGNLGKGIYKIECKQDNYETGMITKEITAEMNGQTIDLPKPTPVYGSLNIESTPNFATVYIDGKKVGETPKSINEILVGTYKIKLTKDGYTDYTETVTIAKGTRKQVQVVMSTAKNAKQSASKNNGISKSKNSSNNNGHDYVDLGLPSGTLWATCNIGANTPEEYGQYFAWGEKKPKSTYGLTKYKHGHGDRFSIKFTKYCDDADFGYKGFTDNLTILLLEDDAADANWGAGWRMPTQEEWQELYRCTTWTWTTQNGVEGELFTAKNGNSLFLPAAGTKGLDVVNDAGSRGFYWSSSMGTGLWAKCLLFLPSGADVHNEVSRWYGLSVRPVRSAPLD